MSKEDKPSAGNDNAKESVGNDDIAPFERWLDRKLKSAYSSVLEEPIPQDILDLLKKKLDGE